MNLHGNSLDTLLDDLNEKLVRSLPCVKAQIVGATKRVEKDGKRLFATDVNGTLNAVVIDDSYEVQGFHFRRSRRPIKTELETYTYEHNLRFVVIANTTEQLDAVVNRMAQVEEVTMVNINDDTYDVLRNTWLAERMNPKSVAIAIDYTITTHYATCGCAWDLKEIAR